MSLLPGNKFTDSGPTAPGTGNPLFPVFLKLNQLHTVLIGGGNVGLEKLSAMISNSPLASVTIISKAVISELIELAADNTRIIIHKKTFEESDLDGANLVIAATNDGELNRFIRTAAHERNLLVNVADKPELCDFYLGSIVKKGDLKIAISTNGKSPTVAKRLKEVLTEGLPNEINTTLQQMSELRNSLSGDFSDKVRKLNQVTAPLVQPQVKTKPKTFRQVWLAVTIVTLLAAAALWYLSPAFNNYVSDINPVFYYFLGAGFLFALIDGAIGMSYGVTTTSFSLSMGIPPASASMGVHLSEILSNGIAGWMHYRMGNINWKLFKKLLIPGIIGAVAGAFLLSSLEHYSKFTKPFVSVYTLILGIVILNKAFKSGVIKSSEKIKKIGLLGLGGGFIDAVGGGGWGSIVLSTLIAGGRNPRFSLGTVKLSRFFIALMSSITFITMLNGKHWEAVAGLVIGSAVASPIAARISNRISSKAIMVAVGIIVILVSIKSIYGFLVKI